VTGGPQFDERASGSAGTRKRTSTPLARQLAGAPAAPGPKDAFVLARRRFLAGQRIDMQAIADELGVSRATVFRWVGNRDQLIGEILWSIAAPTLRHIVESTPGSGGKRVASIMGTFCRVVVDNESFRAYLAKEPEAALKIITRNASTVQPRLVRSLERLLAQEVEDGALDPPLPLPDLAYVIVRIVETFTYNDLITGEPPSPEKAEAAVAALLR
jgi:AcrR family transcriptional regulator